MDIINNGVRAFEIPAGASLTMRQASPGALATAAQVWSDGPTGYTSSVLTSSTPVTIGPFAFDARIAIAATGSVAVDSVGGAGGGSFAAITGVPADNAALAAALNGKADAFAAVVLGAGPTNITHAGHTNRDVSSAQAASAIAVFAATATSGALAGDVVTILNIGPGRLYATGTFLAAPGYKNFADAGEPLIGLYNAATDTYYSNTPNANTKIRGEVSSFAWPLFNVAALQTPAAPVGSGQLGGSTLAGVLWAATNKYTGIPKVQSNGVSAAADQIAGTRGITPGAGASQHFAPAAGVEYGWRARVIGSIADANAAGQFGIGMCATLPAWTAAVVPSAMLNCVFLGGEAGDPNMSIFHNDGTSTCNKVALGAAFPNHTNGADLYMLDVEWRSNGTVDTLTWRAENLITGAFVIGTIVTDKPVAGTPMGWFAARGSAANAVTPTLHFGGWACGDALK